MTTFDPLLAHFTSLNPLEFGHLECLELHQATQPDDWSGFTLKLTMRTPVAQRNALRLAFKAVRNLKLGHFDGLLFYNVEIVSVRDRQLDGINYHVIESEHAAFSFRCDSFSATVD